ncbi:unnamed protein product [Phaedon cochleariae]|uniref:Uncharacterized protein n=1 Tax=Phaedon cochleariae TaxID=80249 RepID=A0A9P0DQ56_PHACE|nr:unnamed protein product [Phaedon cochleariae]
MMVDDEIMIVEQCGPRGDVFLYSKNDNNEIIQLKSEGPPPTTISLSLQCLKNFFCEILLPYGYPESVSEDYLEYQLWDTAQAFCSTIVGAFTTRAILKGVGVGNAQATALSAAVTWILKDGTGMVGRIIFAWWKGKGLDSDCKKWRLFADVLNDLAMTIELFLPFFSDLSMPVLCVSSTMKSIVGIAGGATRASIMHHQAIKDNMAEISAKDGTQETLVNLVASITSIYLFNIFTGPISEMIFVLSLMGLHLLTNYWAVKSLIFTTFNDQRLLIVLRSYFNIGAILNPLRANKREVVILGIGASVHKFCGFNILMGQPLKNVLCTLSPADFQQNLSVYKDKNYFLLVDINERNIYITFEKDETTEEVIAAFFHAVCLGIATCLYNNIPLDNFLKRQLHHPTPMTRLYTFMNSYEKSSTMRNMPYNNLFDFEEFVKQEYSMFHFALQVNGWNMNSHSLNIGDWRSDWKICNKKKE